MRDRDKPMAPRVIKEIYSSHAREFCPVCMCRIDQFPEWNYCPMCGQKLAPNVNGRRMTQEEYEKRGK